MLCIGRVWLKKKLRKKESEVKKLERLVKDSKMEMECEERVKKRKGQVHTHPEGEWNFETETAAM